MKAGRSAQKKVNRSTTCDRIRNHLSLETRIGKRSDANPRSLPVGIDDLALPAAECCTGRANENSEQHNRQRLYEEHGHGDQYDEQRDDESSDSEDSPKLLKVSEKLQPVAPTCRANAVGRVAAGDPVLLVDATHPKQSL